MRIHPFVVTAALMLVGVIALAATTIAGRHARRTRRVAPVAEAAEPPAPTLARREYPSTPTIGRPPDPLAEEAPEGRLRVRVSGPHGLLLSESQVTAIRHADPEDEGDTLDEDEDEPGTFRATELEPGLYDVRVEAPGMRSARVDAVPTGADVIQVSLARLPLLRGAVGLPGEGRCRGVRVTASAPDPGPAPTLRPSQAPVDADDCTFVLEDLPEAGTLTVVARGPGWSERALVMLPLVGDPTFACLRGPCAQPAASLAIYVVESTGAPVEEAALEWSRESETDGELGSTVLSGSMFLHGRRSGQTIHLHATADGRSAETDVVLGEGVTDAVLTFPPGGELTPPEGPNIRPVAGAIERLP